VRLPSGIRNSSAEVKVLYEKTSNIEHMVCKLSKKLDEYYNSSIENQARNEHRFGELEERTATTKYIVFSSLAIALAAVLRGVLW